MRDNCCQPSCRDVTSLPFDPKRVYQRKVSEKKYVDRKWVTIKVEDRKVMGIYCNICLSFSDIKSCFTDGFTKYSHVYERITDHEESKSHNSSVMALFHAQSEKDIETLINVEMVHDRKRAIQDNVLVLQRILEVIKFLGKQALPFRGHRYESVYTLGDRSVDHGNFLGLILLISQFDVPLNNHIHKVIDASKKRHDRLERKGNGRSRGRGNLTTMLSKSTINKILLGILSSLKSKMVEEIGDRRFSVQMDSTQDTSAIDQETTVLRYVVGEEVKERLFSVQNVMDASASGIFQMLKGNLEGNGLKMENVVGESFDGASNMRGQFNGVQNLIKDASPKSIYTWCYAHVLNLAATDMVENIIAVKNLMGLLQSTAMFFSDLCKRMNVWTEVLGAQAVGSAKLKRLQKIGATRWWSKQAALETILGTYDDSEKGTFFVLLQVLHSIKTAPNFNSKATYEATALLAKWCQFDTVLTAFLLLRVYSVLREASDYLQTKGLDYLSAWHMVQSAKEKLQVIPFDEVHEKATAFVQSRNCLLLESDLDIELEAELPESRVSRKKRMPGEIISDEVPQNRLTRFRADVFRRVVDQITNSINERFSVNGELVKDTACLDPRRFKEINEKGVPDNSLEKIADLAGVDSSKLKEELLSFARNFDSLSRTLQDEFFNSDSDKEMDNASGTDRESEDDEEQSTGGICKGSCKKCLACCHRVLYRYSLNAAAFSNLFLVYEYLLTLSFTQVSCERAFSKLKFIKTRLRCNLANEKLEVFMLMCSEKDLLDRITVDDIISILSKNSSVFAKLLTL